MVQSPPTIAKLFFSLLILALVSSCGGGSNPTNLPPVSPAHASSENWPAFTPDPAWQPLVSQAVSSYIASNYTYKINLQDYDPSGDYLNFSLTDFWRNIPNVEQLDAQGVPMIFYNGQFFYNPLTVAEFSLSEHGKWLRGIEPDLSKFWAGVAKLQSMQSPDGGFRYSFDFPYYLNPNFFHAPWTSALAQGEALSVFERAWGLTGDEQYLDAGNRSLQFMMANARDLHFLDPSLSPSLWLDEYPSTPSAYTLNGFMFVMLGLYDWSQLPAGIGALAGFQFARCLDTLDHILPYYDVGGFSAYDLGHITYQQPPRLAPDYHATHIYLLHALHSVTQDATLEKYEMLWRSYVPK
jgi:hypothetical protein